MCEFWGHWGMGKSGTWVTFPIDSTYSYKFKLCVK